jgi:hypothetical protein
MIILFITNNLYNEHFKNIMIYDYTVGSELDEFLKKKKL